MTTNELRMVLNLFFDPITVLEDRKNLDKKIENVTEWIRLIDFEIEEVDKKIKEMN